MKCLQLFYNFTSTLWRKDNIYCVKLNGDNIWTIVLPPKDGEEQSKRITFNAKEYCEDYDPYEVTEDLLECVANAIIEKIMKEY
jgi:hypothetical protein